MLVNQDVRLAEDGSFLRVTTLGLVQQLLEVTRALADEVLERLLNFLCEIGEQTLRILADL